MNEPIAMRLVRSKAAGSDPIADILKTDPEVKTGAWHTVLRKNKNSERKKYQQAR